MLNPDQKDKLVRFSIDIETGGDNPHNRPLLEVGLCVVDEPEKSSTFMFVPDPMTYDREALSAIRRPIEEFISKGDHLVIGINKMLDYIDSVACGRKMEFVGLNMPFDWMFFRTVVSKVQATHKLPHKAYDIPSYGAGVFNLPLSSVGDERLCKLLEITSVDLIQKYNLFKNDKRTHTGEEDAKYQSRLLLALEEYASNKK